MMIRSCEGRRRGGRWRAHGGARPIRKPHAKRGDLVDRAPLTGAHCAETQHGQHSARMRRIRHPGRLRVRCWHPRSRRQQAARRPWSPQAQAHPATLSPTFCSPLEKARAAEKACCRKPSNSAGRRGWRSMADRDHWTQVEWTVRRAGLQAGPSGGHRSCDRPPGASPHARGRRSAAWLLLDAACHRCIPYMDALSACCARHGAGVMVL